jgi:hypothetical protein
MPWTAKDASEFTSKANTDAKKETWAKVANSRLAQCLEAGGDEEECEASAIKVANTMVGNVDEQEPGAVETEEIMSDIRQIARSAIETALAVVNESGEITRARANTLLYALEADLERAKAPTIAEASVFDIGGERVTLQELIAAYGVQEQRSELNGEVAVETDGVAVEVARDATDEDTASLSESEAAVVETGRRAPVVVDFQILEPGPGNRRDNHYYPADVLERDIHVFGGADVFATDHQESERSERTKVGKVLQAPTRFTESRAPVARVLIYDPRQAEKARNRADSGALDTLECSIFGKGEAKVGEIDGREYSIINRIIEGRYLELVSKAGAGGRALNLAEANIEEVDMPEKVGMVDAEQEEVREVDIEEAEADTTESEPAEVAVLTEEAVTERLGNTNLPDFAKRALAIAEYKDEETLQSAIDEAIAEIKQLTGSGEVEGMGESEAPEKSQRDLEEESKRAFNRIMRTVGLAEVEVHNA